MYFSITRQDVMYISQCSMGVLTLL